MEQFLLLKPGPEDNVHFRTLHLVLEYHIEKHCNLNHHTMHITFIYHDKCLFIRTNVDDLY